MIKPTVGRMIWFMALAGDTLHRSAFAGQPLSAQVAAVHDDGTINIAVLDFEGNAHARQRVVIAQEPAEQARFEEDGVPYCIWMPYQQGQAQKNDGEVAELRKGLEELKTMLEATDDKAAEALGVAQEAKTAVDSIPRPNLPDNVVRSVDTAANTAKPG